MRPEFTYVNEYTLGDMLIVDNRSAMHKAGFDCDHSQYRMLYRLLVCGDRPYLERYCFLANTAKAAPIPIA